LHLFDSQLDQLILLQLILNFLIFSVSYSAPFSLASLSEDAHTIYYYSKDNAGNEETQKSKTVILDNSPPETTLLIGTPKYVKGVDTYVTSATTFTLTATDDSGSGVAHTYYRINVGTWTEGTSFTITGSDGTYTYDWYSVDNLGKTEAITVTKQDNMIIQLEAS
jgi:hypothetical protein